MGLDAEKQACSDVYQGALRTNELVDSMTEELGKEASYSDFVYETSLLYGGLLVVMITLRVGLRLLMGVMKASKLTDAQFQEMKSRKE